MKKKKTTSKGFFDSDLDSTDDDLKSTKIITYQNQKVAIKKPTEVEEIEDCSIGFFKKFF